MRVRPLVATLAILTGALIPLRAAGPPKLVVILIVDQLRADYLTTFATHWRRGFRTLLTEGAVFTKAEYPYLHLDTCAGHATVSTGTLPSAHGMIADNWWDRDARRQFECTEDARFPAITYGNVPRIGNSARALLVPTIADELRAHTPAARVVALSLKARGSIGLAGHAGDAVTWFEEAAGTFVTSRAFAERPVAAVKTFIDANPFEADLGKVWRLRDPASMYRHGDAGVGERPPAGWTGLLPHELKGLQGADAHFREAWRRSPMADAYLGRMAASLIDAFALGQRDETDFLGVSFSSLDHVGHLFGPGSREIEDMMAHLDDTLGALIDHLDRTVGRGNFVLALSADHGVAPIPTGAAGGRVVPDDVRDRIEDTLRTELGARDKGSYVDSVYTDTFYLAPGVLDQLRARPGVMRTLEHAVLAIPGVSRLIRTDLVSESSSDPISRAAALSRHGVRNGELSIVPKPLWTVLARASPNAVTHSTPYPYDKHVPLILLGGGVRRGSFDRAVTPADIAPTLAQVAGIRMTKASGRALREALP